MKKLLVVGFYIIIQGLLLLNSAQTRFYLLTCDPGSEVYSLFGHSAIRYEDKSRNLDVVFNYGIFSFETEHFMWKFARGYTDYILATQRFSHFLLQYRKEGRSIVQQELNLNDQEKQELKQLLFENAKAENRLYRYNYFTNNCATKIRDIVYASKSDSLNIPQLESKVTYRTSIKPFLKPFPWVKLGTDLLLGIPADKKINYEALMFLPDHLSQGFVETTSSGNSLVKSTQQIYVGKDRENSGFSVFHPVFVFSLFLVLTIFLSYKEWKHKISLKYFDALLYILMGLGGLLVTFISFISVHPTVFPNIHILWFTPSHLVVGILMCKRNDLFWINTYKKIFGLIGILVFVLLIVGVQKATVGLFPLLAMYLIRTNFYLKA